MKRVIIAGIITVVIIVGMVIVFTGGNDESGTGNETIETDENAPQTDLKPVADEEQEKFAITDVKVEFLGGFTVITGKISNNDASKHDLSVQTNFYNEKNRIAGSADTLLEDVASKAQVEFTMSAMGDLTANEYEVKVEFIK